MPTYHQQMQRIFDQYREEVSSEPADLRTVGEWAIKHRLWAPRPVDIAASFARDMADALREEVRIDKAGRRHRAKIPAKTKTVDGVPLFVWADIDDAPRGHVERNLAHERKQLVAHGYAMRVVADHYNAEHPDEPPLPLILDISEDVEEMLIANGVSDEDEKKTG